MNVAYKRTDPFSQDTVEWQLPVFFCCLSFNSEHWEVKFSHAYLSPDWLYVFYCHTWNRVWQASKKHIQPPFDPIVPYHNHFNCFRSTENGKDTYVAIISLPDQYGSSLLSFSNCRFTMPVWLCNFDLFNFHQLDSFLNASIMF